MTITNRSQEITLQGVAVSRGLAMGSAYLYRDIWEKEPERLKITEEERDGEVERLKKTFESVDRDLHDSATQAAKKFGQDLASIFEAHREMLRDPMLLSKVEASIREECFSADAAARNVFRSIEKRFLSLDDEEFRQRADDVADLARRVLRSLEGLTDHSLQNIPPGSILIAQRVLPSEVAFLEESSTVAIVVEEGGIGSHCALLARGKGIPKVARVTAIAKKICPGEKVIVDGNEGRVILCPSSETLQAYSQKIQEADSRNSRARRKANGSAVTLEGKVILVNANVASHSDAEFALKNGADGIGLYRIEGLYLGSSTIPSEEELFNELNQTLEAFRGKPVVVRLLDIGGDKQLPYLKMVSEPNPFLGRRGVRLLLDFPELLASELRVFLRLSKKHDLKILIPMVTDIGDVQAVNSVLREEAKKLGIKKHPQLGAMIETPAAALFTSEICAEVEFLSIGTNDLTQYIMAAERGNPLVSRYYHDRHPAVFRTLEMICQSAALSKTPVSLCGTLAAWENRIPELLKMGIQSLSVAPPLVPSVKGTVRLCHD